MEINHKIELNMFEFLTNGKFDCIELGQSQEWILNHFPEPDNHDRRYLIGSNIWLYGKIEFHFSDNRLYQIFSDHLQSDYMGRKFHAGEHFTVKTWIFKQPKKLTLDYVMRKFVKLNIDFEKQTNPYSIDLILKSGVKLIFQNLNEHTNRNPNRYLMTAFVFN